MYGYYAGDKLTKYQRRLNRLDSRSWGLFKSKRADKLRSKVNAIQQTRVAMGQPLLSGSQAEAQAAVDIASEEGYLPPMEVQQAAVSTGTLPGGPVPWIVGGALALFAAFMFTRDSGGKK